MKRKKIYLSGILVMALIILGVVPQVYAVTVDLWTQFPDNQGENGFYAYGYNGSTYRPLDDAGTRAFNTPSAGYYVPYIYAPAISPWLICHPSNSEDIVLGWLVPETNIYDISGTVDDWGDGGSIRAYIYQNATWLADMVILSGESDFNLEDTPLQAGDMLYFGINAYGNQGNDTSRVMGQIDYTPTSVIPEPASLSLLGLGLFGLAGFKKRK